jgi:hypothetical protein
VHYAMKIRTVIVIQPMPVAARSEAWVCGSLLGGIMGSKPARGMDICLLRVLYSVKQMSLRRADHLSKGRPVECAVSGCDREASIMSRPWHSRAPQKKIYLRNVLLYT